MCVPVAMEVITWVKYKNIHYRMNSLCSINSHGFHTVTASGGSSFTASSNLSGCVCQYRFDASQLVGGYFKDQISGAYDLQLFGATASTSHTYASLSTGTNDTNSGQNYATVNTGISGSTSTQCAHTYTSGFTITYWFYEPTAYAAGPIVWAWYQNTTYSWEHSLCQDGTHAMFLNSSAGFNIQTQSGNQGVWIFYAIVITGTTVTIYKNGNSTPVTTATTTTNIAQTRSILTFGNTDPFGDYSAVGYLADWRVYNSALSTTTIANIYTANPNG